MWLMNCCILLLTSAIAVDAESVEWTAALLKLTQFSGGRGRGLLRPKWQAQNELGDSLILQVHLTKLSVMLSWMACAHVEQCTLCETDWDCIPDIC